MVQVNYVKQMKNKNRPNVQVPLEFKSPKAQENQMAGNSLFSMLVTTNLQFSVGILFDSLARNHNWCAHIQCKPPYSYYTTYVYI